ncbi:hypothetical protein ABXZ70_004711 [Salmonella enterica]|nr:hypothetical protein [Salmonella enterica]EAU2299091.1 hypothetical protein [Salmonella enterica]EEM3688464.1 hypothetical protein [Salmonella enterica]
MNNIIKTGLLMILLGVSCVLTVDTISGVLSDAGHGSYATGFSGETVYSGCHHQGIIIYM